MIWVIIGAGLLVALAGIVVFFRWQIMRTDVLVLGRCTTCGKVLKWKTRPETVTRMLGGGRGLRRTVEVVDHYCPKCNLTVKHDVLGALKHARQEIGLNDKSNENPQEKGKQLYRSRHYAEAICCFQQMLKQDQDNVLAYLWISNCYWKMRDYDKALEIIAAGLQTDPNDERYPSAGLFRTQGQIHLDRNDIISAVRSFKEAARRHGSADVIPFNYLRAIYDHLNFTTEADFVTKLKQHMEPLYLTDEANAQIHHLCKTCNTKQVEKELWSITELQTIFGPAGPGTQIPDS
jgi:hypothetical protein